VIFLIANLISIFKNGDLISTGMTPDNLNSDLLPSIYEMPAKVNKQTNNIRYY
jgi:ABC-type enterochelin transport system ATPase subunit